ncbi:MAG: hypothetical protein IPM25_19360 [Chloracidobacterium sp.]|nr:hypothetical protein [Chloracidobacterium sp.]
MYLSANLYNGMGRPGAVFLYYNREKHQIAVQPARVDRPDAFPVATKRNGAHWIYARSFCRHHKIRFFASHKFLKPEITEERIVILDLNNTTPVFKRLMLKAAQVKPPPPCEHRPVVDEMLAEWAREDEEQDALSEY